MTRPFGIFGATHHTIFIFGNVEVKAIHDIAKKYRRDIFRVVVCLSSSSSKEEEAEVVVIKGEENHAHTTYLVPGQESGIFVIRTDGVLGAIVDSASGLERYLKLVFA